MAKIFKGDVNFGFVINQTGAQPLDSRSVVQNYTELLKAETFGTAIYNGMTVATIDEQKVYMLIDKTKATIADGWKEIGSDAVSAQKANNYSAALELVSSEELPIGTLIQVENEETIGSDETAKKYNKGFYVVNSTSPAAILYLSTSSGTDVTIDTVVTDVETLKTDVDAVELDVEKIEGEVSGLTTTVSGLTEDVTEIQDILNGKEEVEGLVSRVEDLEITVSGLPETFVTDVKDGENSLVVDGVADLSDFATQTWVKDKGYLTAVPEEYVNKLNNKVDAVDGKGLSTNDFTDALLEKLDGIAAGAEVNYINSIGDNLSVIDGKLEVSIPEVEIPFQSVADGDKVLTLGDDGVLKSDLEFVKETIGGAEYLVVKGKNGAEIGKVATAEFTVDGILDDVKFSTEEGKENILVLTFNADSGKQDIEVDFGKYVDAYSAGTGLTLSNKAFAVDFDIVAKKSDLDALAALVGNKASGEGDDAVEATGIFADLADIVAKDSAQDGLIAAKADKSELDALAALVGNKASGEGDDAVEATGIFAELAALVEKNGEQDSAIEALENLTVNGVGIDDYGTITLDSADIKLNAVIGKKEVDSSQVDRYTTDNDIQYVLNDIDTRIDAINTTIDNVTGGGVIADITAGDGINVDKTTKTNPTISVKVDDSSIKVDSNKKIAIKLKEATDNALIIEEGGLYVQAITIDGNDIEQ